MSLDALEKKGGRPDSVPPYSSCRSGPFDRLRVVQVCLSSNLLHIVALKESTQAGCVVSHGCNVAIGHAIGDFEHFGTVVAVAAAEQTELFGNVVRMLTGDARILARNAGAVGRVATCTGGHAA